MKSRAFLTAVLLTFGMSSPQAAEPARPPYVIVAFGTSLTASTQVAEELRWTHLLEEKLRQSRPDLEITVINAGINGSTSRERLTRLDPDVLVQRPNLVICDFGANDSTFEPNRRVSLEEFDKNIETTRDRIAGAKAKLICWPCTPIVNARHAYGQHPFFASAGGPDGDTAAYRKRLAETCRRLHLPLVDMDAIFREQFKRQGDDAYIAPDGIHFSETGNRLVAESLLPEVEKVIRDKVQ